MRLIPIPWSSTGVVSICWGMLSTVPVCACLPWKGFAVWKTTRQRFEIPDSYQPEAHFSSAFGLVSDTPMKVRVRFSAEIAHTVKDRTWMPGQKVTSDSEGRVTLEFEAAGQMELVSWILSYGIHAEVLEPPELRKEVKRQVKEMRQQYRSKQNKTEKPAKDRKNAAHAIKPRREVPE